MPVHFFEFILFSIQIQRKVGNAITELFSFENRSISKFSRFDGYVAKCTATTLSFLHVLMRLCTVAYMQTKNAFGLDKCVCPSVRSHFSTNRPESNLGASSLVGERTPQFQLCPKYILYHFDVHRLCLRLPVLAC